MMKITIAYFTARNDPKIEWFFRSLKRECKGDYADLDLIIVDFHAEEHGRREAFYAICSMEMGRQPEENWYRHVCPKPCAWQGKYKKTKNEHFAASNARNTAFALCRTDYIACVDDLSVLMPGWILQLQHGAQHRYLALGAYKKVINLDVDAQGNAHYEQFPPGVDSRWNNGSDTGIVAAAGSWLFGCSFGIPLESALRANGFDEACDGQGAEDYDFGIRIERTNIKIFYNRNMLTLESEELHHSPGNQKFIREMKMMKWENYDLGSDHVMLRKVQNEYNRCWTTKNDFNLREMRQKVLAGEPFPIPTITTDWRTGKPLSEI